MDGVMVFATTVTGQDCDGRAASHPASEPVKFYRFHYDSVASHLTSVPSEVPQYRFRSVAAAGFSSTSNWQRDDLQND
ncbi:hypothetical protein BaRGS_00034114 [Batillaria attramentaria]|uniref:Uncharacterized protein n=1 Tax=Batillaria attramentaria TaxID=370345 RepID=A0ABD0JI70_9CAEN